MLNGDEIQREAGIQIEPSHPSLFTPIGYDLRVGEWAFSWLKKKSFEIKSGAPLSILPRDVAIIESLESINLSEVHSGTVHAKMTFLAVKGVSPLPTTIDPGTRGKILVPVVNNGVDPADLEYGAPFCTVCFYRMETRAPIFPGHEKDRSDLKEFLKHLEKEAERAKKELERLEKKYGVSE